MELALALKVLEEDDLEEMCFKEYIDNSWAHLDDCKVEYKDRADDR